MNDFTRMLIAIGSACLSTFALGIQVGRPAKSPTVESVAAVTTTIQVGDVVVDKLDSSHVGVVVAMKGGTAIHVYHKRSCTFGDQSQNFTSRFGDSDIAIWKKED